jgi:putative aminopeptidase FrvX
MDRTPRQILSDLVALPGPPGQEHAVRDYLIARLDELGLPHRTDAKGNLLAAAGEELPERPRIVVTAHMDEIALMVTTLEMDLGGVRVAPLGGVYPWKWGEGPVEILPTLGDAQPIPGILSFGSIHTTSPHSAAQAAREGKALTWEAADVITGRTPADLLKAGVRAGTRVVMARDRRRLLELGSELIGSYFLDDRADLVSWLLAINTARAYGIGADVLFVATTSEEVGGEGAQFLLRSLPTPPEVCIALEIGPRTPDAPFPLDPQPTVWVSDTYAASDPRDMDTLAIAGQELGLSPRFHVVTRGGSDATIAATNGLCARPVTIAFAAENSHGFEIMHEGALVSLAALTVAYLNRV